MNKSSVDFAVRVVEKADREFPADAVLRTELKQAKGISRQQGGEISRCVFAYYRWLGWIDKASKCSEQIEQAVGLASKFAEEPEAFPDEDFEKAVPSWVFEDGLVGGTPTLIPAFSRGEKVNRLAHPGNPELPLAIPAVEANESQPQIRAASKIAWLKTLQKEPQIWLRTRSGTGQDFAQRFPACEPLGGGRLADCLRYSGQWDLFRTDEFQNGEFELQDVNSQAVGWVASPKPGETWWDACAGEGGKALHLSDLMQNKGMLWVSDRAEWRLKKLKLRAARAKMFNYRAAPWDGGAKPPTKTKFDGILVDAPCSGVGTWQRNPQSRWTTSAEDVRELAALQLTLLRNVVSSLKPGGRLVYSVCTLTKAETIGVAEAFSKEFPEMEAVEIRNPLDETEPAAKGLWLWPQKTSGNGMFVYEWKRKK